MPEGKDFLGELVVLLVVDAVTELEELFECLPAGILQPHRKKWHIVPNTTFVRYALRMEISGRSR